MIKELDNDYFLCKEMMADLNNENPVDDFWLNYQNYNVAILKYFGLNNFRNRPNSYGGITSKKMIIPKGSYFNRILIAIGNCLTKFIREDGVRFPMLDAYNFVVDDPVAIRSNYASLILETINLLPDAERLLDIRDDLAGNPADILNLRGHNYSLQFVHYFYRLLVMNRFMNFKESDIFFEIGGGYGGFSEVLKKTYPNVKIIFIDIPPQLYVAEQYLKKVFPDRIAGYRETRKMKSISKDTFSRYDVLILAPWDIEKIEDDLVDNFSNQSSFQEMSKETVKDYCEQLGRIVKNKVVLYEQREGNGAAKDSVTREDYIKNMKSNGFCLASERTAIYGGNLEDNVHRSLSHQDFYFFQKE